MANYQIANYGDIVARRFDCGVPDCGICLARFEAGPQRKMNLSNLAKKLLDADTKVLVKAGILDSELDVTEKGKDFILAHYVQANKKALADEARKLLKEEK